MLSKINSDNFLLLKIQAVLILLFIASCNTKPAEDASVNSQTDGITDTNQQSDTAYHFTEAFKGTLRCADCKGVQTEITFINEELTYKETRAHIGKNNTENLTGSYTTDRGYKEDDDATVYVLDYNKPGLERRFLKLDDSTLIKLDAGDNVADTTSFAKLFRIK